jgi:Domain of unknown function (DUF4232)
MKTVLIAALAAAGLITCACSAQGGGVTPQATVTVTASAAVSAAAAATGAAQPGPATSAAPTAPQAPAVPAAAAPCLTRYLGASTGLSQGTAGSTYVVIVFRNLNNAPCTLYGYPGVALTAGLPVRQLGLAAAENPATPRQLVTLAPLGRASALLRIVHAGNYPPAACNPATSEFLQVYPPNQTVPVYIGYHASGCAGNVRILTVDAVRPGSGG